MLSSIQISQNMKKELISIKGYLEKTTGKKHSLEDAIKWLINQNRIQEFEERKKIALELCGSIKFEYDPLERLSKLRKEKWSRYE